MFEWVLILVVAMVAVLAFLYLLHNTPGCSRDKGTSRGKKTSLAKPAREQHSGDEKEPKGSKASKEKRSPRSPKSPKSPQKDDKAGVIVFSADAEEPEENHDEDVLRFFKANQQAKARSAAAAERKEEPKKKVEKVTPTRKQIERDLQQGFVLVTKKGVPQLSPEQRLERAESRRAEKKEREREEEEQKMRQNKALQRKRERGSSPPSQPQEKALQDMNAGLIELRNKREEERGRKQKTEPLKITVYNTPKAEGEQPPKIWSSLGAQQNLPDPDVDVQVDTEFPCL